MSPLLTLEALKAREGDSLLLHYGDADDPKLILIDGGPAGVYREALAPRLAELRSERGVETLPLELLMISHVDSDHVRGILDLSRAMLDDESLRASLSVGALWYNSFEDALGGESVAELAELVSSRPVAVAEPAGLDAVVASVGEGRDLRGNSERLGWPLNPQFDELVMAPESGRAVVESDDLKLTVVGPLQAEVDAFRDAWDEEIAKLREKQASEGRQADFSDDSPWNLASIVCLAELGGKRILLTGDALGSKVLDGLRTAELLDADGGLELDLLKVPHHGSDRNVDQAFFEVLPAKHYLISADGRHHNPDLTTLKMISAARPDDDFTVHLTYRDFKEGVGPAIHRFFDEERADGRAYDVNFRDEDALSLSVALL